MVNTLARRCVFPAVSAAVLTAALLYLVRIPSSGPTVLSYIMMPFIMVGALLSGNIHQPSVIGMVGSMFLFFFVITFGLQWAWRKLVGGPEAAVR